MHRPEAPEQIRRINQELRVDLGIPLPLKGDNESWERAWLKDRIKRLLRAQAMGFHTTRAVCESTKWTLAQLTQRLKQEEASIK